MGINTDRILSFIHQAKNELNKLPDHILSEKNTEAKELYITFLSSVVFVDGGIGKDEMALLSSILNAAGIKEEITAYFSKAEDLNLDTLQEFIDKIIDEKLQYSFILDSLILSAMEGKISDKKSDFIGELAEVLKIEKEEMEFLCDLAICILEENNEKFNELIKSMPDKISILEFKAYLDTFINEIPSKDEFITGEVHLTGIYVISKPIINEGVLNIENASIIFKNRGKIISREGSELYIKSSEIIGGEFILEEKSKLAVTDSLFRDNNNKRVFTLQQCKRQNFIEGCTFQNCSLDDNGGVIYILESVLEMNKNTFINCKSNRNGGAIYIDGEIERVISWSNLKFIHCESERGGAVYQNCYNIYYFLSESIFNECKANKSGGAIYIRNENYEYDALVTKSEFNNCSAKHVGAVFLYYGYADRNIVGCRFNKCISIEDYISGIGIFNISNSFGNENIFSNCINPIGNVVESSHF